MEELNNISLDSSTINIIKELYPDITDNEIVEKEAILYCLNCTPKQISNIINTNPYYLNKLPKDIYTLIKYLKDLGFTSLNLLLETNPYILNLEKYEIEKYINKRLNNKGLLSNIIDDLDSNPILFNEM